MLFARRLLFIPHLFSRLPFPLFSPISFAVDLEQLFIVARLDIPFSMYARWRCRPSIDSICRVFAKGFSFFFLHEPSSRARHFPKQIFGRVGFCPANISLCALMHQPLQPTPCFHPFRLDAPSFIPSSSSSSSSLFHRASIPSFLNASS